MGTPRYMAPEQVTRRAGRRAQRSVRRGRDPVRDARRPSGVRRAAPSSRSCTRRCYEQPPALTGSPAVAAVDRVIRRALAKRPADRPASADAMAEELRAVRGVGRRRHAGAGPRADAPRRAAVPRPAPRSRDRLPGLQPAGRDRDVAVGHRLAGRALERHRRALRRRGAGSQGAGRGGRRRSRGHGHAAARPAISCGRRRSSSRRRAARCSRRTRSSRRWAICSGCRTTSRGASWRRCRCRWRARRRRPRPTRRTTRAPTSSTCARTSWRARYDGLAAGARSVRAVPGAGSALRAGVGAPRPLPPRDRQVHRRHARQRGARRGGLPPRARAQPAAVGRAQVLREPRGGHRPGRSARSCACSARPNRHGNDPELFAGLVHACRYCGLFEQSIAAHAEARRLDPERARPASSRRC